MIIAYIGKRGTGKTLRMVAQAVKDMKRGKRCISNTRIKFEHKGKTLQALFFKDAKQFEEALITAYNATICIDEAGLIFDSQMWNRLPHHVKVKFMESRKDACNLYYTAQGMNHVNERLRSVTEQAVYCWKVYPLGIHYLPHIRLKYLPLLWRTFPKFIQIIKKLLWAIRVQEPNAQLHYKKALKWYLHNITTRIFRPIDAYGLKGAYTNTGNLMGHKQVMGKKWWEGIYKTDVLYPSQYRRVWKCYDTMLHVDSYMFIRKRKKQLAAKQTKPVIKTNGMTNGQNRLIAQAKQSLEGAKETQKLISNTLVN